MADRFVLSLINRKEIKPKDFCFTVSHLGLFTYLILKNELKRIINEEEDSLRFYNLGAKYDSSTYRHRPSIPIDVTLNNMSADPDQT